MAEAGGVAFFNPIWVIIDCAVALDTVPVMFEVMLGYDCGVGVDLIGCAVGIGVEEAETPSVTWRPPTLGAVAAGAVGAI